MDFKLILLPHLPIPLDCGRLIDLIAPGIGTLDLEWSKKVLRCVILRATTSGEVILELQNGLSSFRLKTSLKEKGIRHQGTEPLRLEAGKVYYLDRFQK